jgi:hypothetical protein
VIEAEDHVAGRVQKRHSLLRIRRLWACRRPFTVNAVFPLGFVSREFEHRRIRLTSVQGGERDHPPFALQVDDSPGGAPLIA